jgi:hypothetical protein
MSYWEYCEVGWTPKQITIHVYSGRVDGSYEGIQDPQEWGRLLWTWPRKMETLNVEITSSVTDSLAQRQTG